MCLAQGPQRCDACEARTCDPSVSSQALYHWATALPCLWWKFVCLLHLSWNAAYILLCLFVLMLYIPVTNFSVMMRWFPEFLDWTSTKQRVMCLTQWHNEGSLPNALKHNSHRKQTLWALISLLLMEQSDLCSYLCKKVLLLVSSWESRRHLSRIVWKGLKLSLRVPILRSLISTLGWRWHLSWMTCKGLKLNVRVPNSQSLTYFK